MFLCGVLLLLVDVLILHMYFYLKGRFTQKLKFSLFFHTLMPIGKSGEVFTEHFWSFTSKQHCRTLLNNWCRWGLVLKHKKNNRIKGSIQLAWVPGSPKIPNWFEKTIFTFSPLSLPANTLSFAAAVKISVLKKGVNNILLNPFRTFGLFQRFGLHQASCMEPLYVSFAL